MTVLVIAIDLLFRILQLLILVRVILSWLNIYPHRYSNPLVNWVYEITEPILAPLRNLIGPVGMLDFSPLIALIVLQIVEQILINILR